MSYILDALKKVEHEKQKKSAPGGMTGISGELFHERAERPALSGRLKIVALISVAVIMTFLVTWMILKDNKRKPVAAIVSTPVPTSVVAPVVLPQPVIPIAAPVPIPQSAPLPVTNNTPIVQSVPTASQAEDDEERPVRRVKRASKHLLQPVAPLQLKPVAQSVQAPADIKLSGIAWQDERSARRAVVNGFLLKEGASVSGARITEIKADRVRFALPGGSFELRLDSVSVGEVNK